MFTQFDKAITALILAVIFLINFFFGANINLTEAQVNGINAMIAAISPFVVYLVPNKEKKS